MLDQRESFRLDEQLGTKRYVKAVVEDIKGDTAFIRLFVESDFANVDLEPRGCVEVPANLSHRTARQRVIDGLYSDPYRE